MSKSIRESVDHVRRHFPPGCQVRHKETGALFTMGTREGRSSFWLMQHKPQRKGVIAAHIIETDYEVVK
jgi:hypothetical protein